MTEDMKSDIVWRPAPKGDWECNVGPLLVTVSQRFVPIVKGIYRIAKEHAWRWQVGWVDDRDNYRAILDFDRSDGGYEGIEDAKEKGLQAAERVRERLR